MRHAIVPVLICLLGAAGAVLPICVQPAFADRVTATHLLDIRLDPTGNSLTGSDTVEVTVEGRRELEFRLSPRVRLLGVTVDDHPHQPAFADGRLRIALAAGQSAATTIIQIRYTGLFKDPVPVRPLNVDNPGFGVSGTISPEGCLLLDGAGWYPAMLDGQAVYRLKVTAPEGWLAVTAGRSVGHRNENGRGVSEWVIDHPVDGLALSAGPYRVTERKVGAVKAVTYFFADEPALAQSYLDAAARYLEQYTALFGPYPFDKFAVVENFFPTGYGFPSYTLIGGTVLRLPFIITTSLGHEIAHCWWGNGVWVDYSRGNWGEGLTTYLADYLYKEQQSQAEAEAYRREMLRNYATLAAPEDDFPLADFRSRTSPLTKSIGYDKGAMVFHMLRRLIGEDAFWGGLRDIYRQYLFREASWDDLRAGFERRAQRPLHEFFAQWIAQPGAPRLRLADVSAERKSEGRSWRIRGRIVQQKPLFAFPLVLELKTKAETLRHTIQVQGRQTAFEFTGAAEPQRLTADPHADLMRRLDPLEIPPTVNSLKGSANVTVLLAEGASSREHAAETLIVSLGLENHVVIALSDLPRGELPDTDLLVIGYPRASQQLAGLLTWVSGGPGEFQLEGARYDRAGDKFFGVFAHPTVANRAVGIYFPLSDRDEADVARKITHYGKYSYLAFRDGRNTAKGVWPADRSPLEHHWVPQ